jgi:sec-independent protein translocase protein TatA
MKLFEPPVMIILLAIVLIIFGPKNLPELGKTIGQTIRGFRQEFEAKPADKELAEKPETAE